MYELRVKVTKVMGESTGEPPSQPGDYFTVREDSHVICPDPAGHVTTQTRYGLTSLSSHQAHPEQLLDYVRAYWGIENRLHYRRDVTFKEDRCRLRIGHAARTMATLNNLVLTLILRQGYSNVPQARRRFAPRPLDALKPIFQQP